MIKTIVIDLGGVYFEAGTGIASQKIYKLVSVSKEKADEIFEGFPKKEGWLYRRGQISKEEFWKSVVEKLEIDKEMVPKLQEIWHSSYKPIKGMKELVSELRKKCRVIAFSGNVKERIEYLNEKYKLKEDFDDFVLSFDTGFTKQEIEFYRILLRKINVDLRNAFLLMTQKSS